MSRCHDVTGNVPYYCTNLWHPTAWDMFRHIFFDETCPNLLYEPLTSYSSIGHVSSYILWRNMSHPLLCTKLWHPAVGLEPATTWWVAWYLYPPGCSIHEIFSKNFNTYMKVDKLKSSTPVYHMISQVKVTGLWHTELNRSQTEALTTTEASSGTSIIIDANLQNRCSRHADLVTHVCCLVPGGNRTRSAIAVRRWGTLSKPLFSLLPPWH